MGGHFKWGRGFFRSHSRGLPSRLRLVCASGPFVYQPVRKSLVSPGNLRHSEKHNHVEDLGRARASNLLATSQLLARRHRRRKPMRELAPEFAPLSLFAVLLVVIWFVNSLKILREYERGVIFRLGRLLPQPKGRVLSSCSDQIDRIVRVSLRTVTLEVPPQDIITRTRSSIFA
jgi:hypothetical protein